jgi:hypothetical protein
MADKKAKGAGDAGAAEVQDAMDDATAKGYIGEVPDPTPNAHYTVAGVTAGKPTPETDKAAKAAADDPDQHGK